MFLLLEGFFVDVILVETLNVCVCVSTSLNYSPFHIKILENRLKCTVLNLLHVETYCFRNVMRALF